MPLLKSVSDKAVGENIKREEAAGKPHKQAVAIALDTQRRAKMRRPSEESVPGKIDRAGIHRPNVRYRRR